jgi:hypothetical protein
MKKIIIFLLMVTFFAPSLLLAEGSNEVTTSANATGSEQMLKSSLEKIPSPEQIKNFTNIKKEGNALFGVRIQQLETKIQGLGDKLKEALNKPAVRMATSTNPTPNTIASSTKGLEKISNPKEIALFEKIKQVGTTLWGYRKATKENLGASVLTSETVTCLKTAIDKKDMAVKDSIASSSESLIKATTDRNTCQKYSLDKPNNSEIMQGFKICKDNFNNAIKESRMSSKKFRDAAWKVYQQEVKACYKTNTTATSTEIKSEGANVLLDDGGNNLEL